MERKTVVLKDFKILQEGSVTYITGYANTKGHPDAYGDIPVNFNGMPIYDLDTAFKHNPVALLDHENEVSGIFGSFIVGPGATEEDEIGLKIKLRLMEDPQTDETKHAVAAFKSGYARAFSIGGQWFYEDPANPKHLTRAVIYEISAVAIGADPFALASTPKPKSAPKSIKPKRGEMIEALISEYRVSGSEKALEAIKALQNLS